MNLEGSGYRRSLLVSARALYVCVAVCVCFTLTAGDPATAHHSAALFDQTRCQTVTGTMRSLQWQYPHSWLWIVVPNSSGAGDIWGFEMPAPSSLARSPAWSRQALEKGEKLTVSFAPLRDGRNAGLANAIRRADGKVLHAAPNAFACEKEHWTQAPSGSPIDAKPRD
jgi:Family of unknown function (DUF6152)